MKQLSSEEVLALETILVEDNEKIVGVMVEYGTTGVGGCNRSGFSADSFKQVALDDIAGKAPYQIKGIKLCAVVSDVMYFRNDNGDVFPHKYDECFRLMGENIAYDTYTCTCISALLK
ncbi:MAG: hypothetical protein ACI396_05515 [Acutalibacteraceae bacterium]